MLDTEFDSETSNLVLGPINKQRWIYACAKQLMDRVIHRTASRRARLHAVPAVQLDRLGPGLDQYRQGRQLARDHPVPRPHRARRADQAGRRRHAKTRVHLIDDGVSALMRIIANENGVASGKIYNVGNPRNNYSVRSWRR